MWRCMQVIWNLETSLLKGSIIQNQLYVFVCIHVNDKLHVQCLYDKFI